ncbi:MAG: hypothetical protein AAB438_01845 [Patescibacteria group bacterium]
MDNNEEEIKKEISTDVYKNFKEARQASIEIHNRIKKLGYEYVLEKLKKYGFEKPEEFAKEILNYQLKELPKTKQEKDIDNIRNDLLKKFSN